MSSTSPLRTLAAVVAACGSYALVQSLALPTIPVMNSSFGVSTATSAWVLLAFLITSCAAAPVLGAFGDRLGRRRVLVACLGCLLMGCLVSAAAPSIGWVLVGRALQGVSGATFPLAFAVIGAELPARRTGLALGLVSSTFSIAGVLGLPLGGFLLQYASWRWCYLLPALLALAALAAVQAWIPRGAAGPGRKVDLAGGALLATWLGLLLLSVTDLPRGLTATTVALTVVAVATLVAWVGVELRAGAPLVDLRLVRRPPVPLASVCALALGWVQIGVISLIPVELTDAGGFALPSSTVGLLYVPGFLVAIVAAPLGGVMGARRGYRSTLLLGLLLVAIGTAVPALWSRPWAYMVLIGVCMTGATLAFAALPGLLVTALPQSEVGSVTGLNTVLRSVGGAAGASVGAAQLAGSGLFVTYLWGSVVIVMAAATLAAVARTSSAIEHRTVP